VSLETLETIRIATRKSPLALWQAEYVATRLRSAHPELQTELVRMTTRGDKILDTPLAKVGGKGLFIKELEQGLLNGTADIAVHSMKDVPVEFPPGLQLGAVLQRHDPRDAMISNRYQRFSEIPAGAKIGTSSLRRQCQIKKHNAEYEIISLRGNVNTRLSKLDAGIYDAIVLAAAGMERLGLHSKVSEYLDPSFSLPAIGQGAIGVECRSDAPDVMEILSCLNDDDTRICVTAERAMNRTLEGGCQVPIAGFAELKDGVLRLRGLVGRPDGSKIIRSEASGQTADAEQIGQGLADELLCLGADKILREL